MLDWVRTSGCGSVRLTLTCLTHPTGWMVVQFLRMVGRQSRERWLEELGLSWGLDIG